MYAIEVRFDDAPRPLRVDWSFVREDDASAAILTLQALDETWARASYAIRRVGVPAVRLRSAAA